MRAFIILAAGLWFGLYLPSARADETRSMSKLVTLDQAIAHLKNAQFDLASQELHVLAQAGVWGAYANLGTMALNNQGPNSGYGEALGWFKAAEELGPKIPDNWTARLDEAVTPSQRETAQKIVGEFSKEASLKRLLSAVHPSTACSDSSVTRDDPRITQPKRIKSDRSAHNFFPAEAVMAGQQGVLIISAFIDSDGRAKDPRVESVVPVRDDVGFSTAAASLLQHTTFEPASLDGNFVPRRYTLRVRFGISDADGFAAEFWNKKTLAKLNAQAQTGDASAELSIAYLGIVDKEVTSILKIDCGNMLRMAVSSALAGAAESEFWLSRWLSDSPHPAAAQMSDAWLREAARRNFPRAQLLLATQAMERPDAVDHVAEIKERLLKAADSNDEYARRRAAFLLATASLREVRDAGKALEVAQKLKSAKSDNPELDLVLAAAQAASSKYADAIKTQERAIKKATRLSWNVAPLEDTLSTYKISAAPNLSSSYLSWSDDKANFRDAFR